MGERRSENVTERGLVDAEERERERERERDR